MEDTSRHKAELRDKRIELRDLLNEWDPIAIRSLGDVPADEYDCFSWLLGDLYQGRSVAAVAERLRDQLSDHFGLDPEQSQPVAFAERVYAWYWADPIPGSVRPSAGSGFVDPRPA